MNISYQAVSEWFKDNLKLLVILEIACLLVSGIYFLMAPRIYEANFSISLPKVAISPESNPPKLRLLISPQEFIRPTQDPMAYSAEFMKSCMGEDTNANRKKLINGLQLGVKQQGDVIVFTFRLEGKERLVQCSNLMMWNVLNNLNKIQENYLSSQILTPDEKLHKTPAAMVSAVRMSDSYIKPDLSKSLVTALLAGGFLAVFLSALRKKYRA